MQHQNLLLLASFFGLITAKCLTGTETPCVVPTKPPCDPAPPHQTSPCMKDLHIIVSRATTECMGIGTSDCVVQGVLEKFDSADVDWNPYPATAGDGLEVRASIYVASETEGVQTLTKMIKDYQNACPNTPIALIGYSQGAQVVGDVLYGNTERNSVFLFPPSDPLPPEYRKNIAAVVLFGDPSFMSGKSWNRGNSTGKGSWFPRKDTEAAKPYADLTRSYCDAGDSFCDCGYPYYTEKALYCLRMCPVCVNTHKGYIYCSRYTKDAINFIVSTVKKRKGDPDQIVIEAPAVDTRFELV